MADRASPACLDRVAVAEGEPDDSALEAPLAAADDRPAEVLEAAEQVRSVAEEPVDSEALDGSCRADFVEARSAADVPERAAERCSASHSDGHSVREVRLDGSLLDSQQDDCSAPADSSQDGCSVVLLQVDRCVPVARTDDSIPACWAQADSQQAALVPDDCSPVA